MVASRPPTLGSSPSPAPVDSTASGTSQVDSPERDRWLWNPAVDLLLGCGLLYAAILAVLVLGGPTIRLGQPAFLFPLLILLVSTPHYGATLVRVYEEASERRRYVLFATWLSLLIWGAVALGLFNAMLASILATLLFTWSPWHYTGQNYGIAMLFLRRRGVEVSKRAKRLLYASFVLSFAMVFLNLNAAGSAPSATPRGYTATDVQFISLDIPAPLVDSLLAFLVVGFAATLAGAGIELSRKARVRDLIPSALLSVAQVFWFTLPLMVYRWKLAPGLEAMNIEHRTYYFVWVGLAHGIQYLWITSYYGKSSERWRGVAPYWGKTLLAGTAVWTLPVLLFSPIALGRLASEGGGTLSYDTGLALLVAAGVNLHHFMLDGVIWKLRNMRIAGVLIRDTPMPENTPSEIAAQRGGPMFARRALWGIAGAALSVALFVFFQQSIASPLAWERGEYATLGRILDRLAWFGYDSHEARSQLGDALRAEGDAAGSVRHYEASLQLKPGRADVHYRLANALRADGRNEDAVDQYRLALAILPNFADAHYNLGNALAAQARYSEAIAEYQQAIAARPDFARAHNNLGNALQTQGDLDGAITHYREALRIKPGYSSANDNLGRALRQKW